MSGILKLESRLKLHFIVACGFALLILYSSCRHRNEQEQLLGSWRSVKIENPDIDSFFTRSQRYIDTVGRGNDSQTNIMLYGVANMDSVRALLQLQYDSVRALQLRSDTQTVFEFLKDSVVNLRFSEHTETGKWYFNGNGAIVLEGVMANGQKDMAQVEIVTITPVSMKLKFVKSEGSVNDTSFVTFARLGK